VAAAGANPAAGPGTELKSSVSDGVAIAVAAAASGIVGIEATGVADSTSSVWLGLESEPNFAPEPHAATASATNDNAVKNATFSSRILGRINTSIIVTGTPRSLPLPYSTATTYGPNPLCDLSFVVK
jgi:hypothetical protein